MGNHELFDRLLDLAGFRGESAAAFRALRSYLVHDLPDVGLALLHATGLPEGHALLAGLIAADGTEVLAGQDVEHAGNRLPRFNDALTARCVSSDAPLRFGIAPYERGVPLAQALLAPASLLVLPVDDHDRSGYRLVITSTLASRFDGLDLGLLWRQCRLAFAILAGGFRAEVVAHQQHSITGLAEIQRLLQPHNPKIRGLSYAVHWQPAETAAGDYYDLMCLSHVFSDYVDCGVDAWAMLVADVSGHGAAAAMEAVQFDAILRTYAGDEEPRGPAGALTYANRHFFSRRQRPHFLTAFHIGGRADLGGLMFVNAGHLPALRRRQGQVGWLGRDDDASIPLGILREHRWQNTHSDLQAGDLLVVYTDGIVEARDRRGKPFGSERIAQRVAQGGDDPVEVRERIVQDLFEHQDSEVGSDDQTLLLVRQDAVGSVDTTGRAKNR